MLTDITECIELFIIVNNNKFQQDQENFIMDNKNELTS